MQDLKPASELAAASTTRWTGESAEYRQARTALLAEEIALRRQIQRVAAQRRALPPGPVAKDYRFLDEQGKEVGLADLFGGHDTLFAYFWMFGPERERPCPMCTSFVGSLDIPAPDIEQRIALAIVGRSPVERQLAFARERGWLNLKFYQTVGDDYRPRRARADRRGRRRGGDGLAPRRRPGPSVLGGRGRTETADPGFDAHLAPDPTPLWNILDMTPGGRGTDWYPKLEYGAGQ